MICRRGGIVKQDIGAIRIYGAHTEFEISAQAAENFSVNLKRPDKEENIRIEQLQGGPQGEAPTERPADKTVNKPVERAAHAQTAPDAGARDNPGFKKKPDYAKKRDFHSKHRRDHKPPHGGQARRDDAKPFVKPAFGEKPKKDFKKNFKKNKFHG
jgi:ATP-dependent RNA helicase DeaD